MKRVLASVRAFVTAGLDVTTHVYAGDDLYR
jgi:hypothetical protein